MFMRGFCQCSLYEEVSQDLGELLTLPSAYSLGLVMASAFAIGGHVHVS